MQGLHSSAKGTPWTWWTHWFMGNNLEVPATSGDCGYFQLFTNFEFVNSVSHSESL